MATNITHICFGLLVLVFIFLALLFCTLFNVFKPSGIIMLFSYLFIYFFQLDTAHFNFNPHGHHATLLDFHCFVLFLCLFVLFLVLDITAHSISTALRLLMNSLLSSTFANIRFCTL